MREIKYLVVAAVLLLAGCQKKELDMTVMQKTLFEGAVIQEITVKDGWNVTIVQDDESTYVALEYSAFLEDYFNMSLSDGNLTVLLKSHSTLPTNTVMNATIHTPMAQRITLSEAVSAVIEGHFESTSLTLELDGASTCKGGVFQISGPAHLQLTDASKIADCYVFGDGCAIVLDNASTFKGSLYNNDTLNIKLDGASRMTTYDGVTLWARVEVCNASSLNMLKTSVPGKIHIVVEETSEASVAISQPGVLEGAVRHNSILYYQGTNPTLNVDCDETSIIRPL